MFIPHFIMMVGMELDYLEPYLTEIENSLTLSEDKSTIYLVLHFYLEHKNLNSFWKPYIDLIFTNTNYLEIF